MVLVCRARVIARRAQNRNVGIQRVAARVARESERAAASGEQIMNMGVKALPD